LVIIGIDPSSSAVGWCIFEENNLMEYGEIKPSSHKKIQGRLLTIYNQLTCIVNEYKPSIMVIEDQVIRHIKSAKILCQVRGVVELVGAIKEIESKSFYPSSLKLDFTGSGRASKDDMVKAAMDRYNIKDITDNMADAMAAVYTYLNRGK